MARMKVISSTGEELPMLYTVTLVDGEEQAAGGGKPRAEKKRADVLRENIGKISRLWRKLRKVVGPKGEQAEIMEAVALETSDIVGKPLKDITFPKGALVASIIRNDQIIIPSGESIIKPEDRIIIFARRQSIDKIEKILAVKLEFF